jgi:hypothetical protein
MSHIGKNINRGSMIVCASFVLALFTGAPLQAQPQPIVVSPDVSSPKPLSVISSSGSYVLSRNILNKSSLGADSVQVTASNVVIDLAGFSIICSGSSTGAGINATGQANVVIRDGIITGCGGPAIITGANANISGITAIGNSTTTKAGPAIQTGTGSQITSNTINGSGAGGVTCGTGTGCLVSNNVIQGNVGVGITFSDTTGGFGGNVLQGNDGNTVGTSGQFSEGKPLGTNLCNGVTC